MGTKSGSSDCADVSREAWILANRDPLKALPRDACEESSRGMVKDEDMVLQLLLVVKSFHVVGNLVVVFLRRTILHTLPYI